MANPRESTLRMGGAQKGPAGRPILFGAAAAILVIGIIVLLLSIFSGETKVAPTSGCKSDDACGNGRICAMGGCILLSSSQHAGLWHDDLKDQADAGVGWQVRAAHGERMLPCKQCPAKAGKVEPQGKGELIPLAEATVHQVSAATILTTKQVRFKGTVWIGTVRFRFPEVNGIEKSAVCTSDRISEVAVGTEPRGGGEVWFVDGSLTKTVPVGAEGRAAVAIRRTPGLPDETGCKTLSFPLVPAFGGDFRRHSVAVFPLGSDIEGITGPPPTQQRLLNGYVAYYWEHKPAKSHVSIQYRIQPRKLPPLDITTVKP